MTAPGDPRIQINPDEAARATLPEWIEVEEDAAGYFLVRHVGRDHGHPPYVVRVDSEATAEQLAIIRDELERWSSRPEGELKMLAIPKTFDFVNGTLRMHRRDLCALADYVAMVLWQPEDSEDGDGNKGVTGVSAPKEEETPAPTHRERENP